MTSPLREDVDGSVAILTFDRPDQANTWSVELHVAYRAALARLAEDPDVRAVVVTGAGRHFCAGADMSLLDHIESGGALPPELDAATFLEPLDFPKPLIAAVNGSAAGIGLVHALLCDVRFASAEAVFTTAFTRRGLVAEHGTSWLLPQVVGRAHALDMLLSARRVRAEEALQIGLVHAVCPGGEELERAVAYAQDLAQHCSPAAMAVVKQQVTRHSVMEVHASEAETVDLVDQSLEGPDFTEGVRSFVERRPAAFPPLGEGTAFRLPGSVDPLAVTDGFFAATQANDWAAALALLAPDAVVRTHPGTGAVGVDSLLPSWERTRQAFGRWEYVDVRRVVGDAAVCEQHVVRFVDLEVEVEACVVLRFDGRGRIVRLDEYVDATPVRDARRARADALGATA